MNYRKKEAKEYAREKLTGLWVAITNPFSEYGEIDIEGLKRNLEYYSNRLNIEGVFFNGLMGEFWALSKSERMTIHEVVSEALSGKLLFSPMTTHHSIRETIALTSHAQDVNADFVVLMNPYLGQKSESNIYSYYRTICDSVDIAIILFNSPSVGYSMSPKLIEKLSEIQNICAIKNTDSLDHTLELRRRVGKRIVVSDPLEEFLFVNAAYFGQKVFYADPEPYLYQTPSYQPIRKYFELILRDEIEAASKIYCSLYQIRKVYAKWIMGPLSRGEMPNAALKFWSEYMNLAGGTVRPPLKQLSGEQKHQLEKDLDSLRWA